MRTSIGLIALLVLPAVLAPAAASAATNNAYADATGANGLTVHSVFPATLNGSALDATGQVTESLIWSPVPVISLSTSPGANAGASGYADFSYGFTVSDNGAVITTPVPIDIVGNYQLTTQQGQPGYVTAQLGQIGGVGAYSFTFTSTSLGGAACSPCIGSFAGTAQLSIPGSTQVSTLSGNVDMIVNVGTFNGNHGAVTLDPYLSIDPAWAATHPGFTLTTEAGVGNGLVTPVPEPASWLMLSAGLLVVAWRCRRLQTALHGRP